MDLPNWLDATILGLIEGLTEFIPVSSTGHLLIAEHWLGKQSDLFNVIIQPAAVLALLPIFWTKLQGLVFGLGEAKNRDLLMKLAVAFGITVAGGLIMKKLGVALPKELGPIAMATLVGGFVILAVEYLNKGKQRSSEVTWTIAIAFGLGQLIAIAYPGASRSGSTIMIAMLLGLARPAATEFSFLIGIPTLFAAAAKELLDTFKNPEALQQVDWVSIGCGAIAAFVSAFLVVKWLIRFVQHNTFNGFAIYRILLGAALLIFFVKA
jgi:undecaprenyl-diphosphatase